MNCDFVDVLDNLSPSTLRTISNFEMLRGILDVSYGDPRRMYHNYDHIVNSLRTYHQLVGNSTVSFQIAILFHDVVYEFGAKDNEERSAWLFWNVQRKIFDGMYIPGSVRAFILATKNPFIDHDDDERNLFVDVDMSTLGTPWVTYKEYQDRIREEYWQIATPSQYRLGRIDFLKKVLATDKIFRTKQFEMFEKRARDNVQAELAILEVIK